MPVNPLERAIKSGISMNDRIGDLFARIGTTAHPRGEVLSNYATARLALQQALVSPQPLADARDILRNLRRQLNSDVGNVFADAIALGQDEVTRQLRFYDVRPRGSIRLTEQTQSAIDNTMARFDAQSAAITALVIAGATPDEIIGDAQRTGIFSASEVTAAAAYWATFLVWNAFDETLQSGNSDNQDFQKQAVAALDARTTDCCLQVHGQIRPLDEPFHLTGTPRYADYQDWPGFHWYCRTSGVLYQDAFDDGLTAKMRDGADFFLAERAKGNTPDNSPVDAFK